MLWPKSVLTHLILNRMTDILQTVFSNTFTLQINSVFLCLTIREKLGTEQTMLTHISYLKYRFGINMRLSSTATVDPAAELSIFHEMNYGYSIRSIKINAEFMQIRRSVRTCHNSWIPWWIIRNLLDQRTKLASNCLSSGLFCLVCNHGPCGSLAKFYGTEIITSGPLKLRNNPCQSRDRCRCGRDRHGGWSSVENCSSLFYWYSINTRNATIFTEISSAILNDVIWSEWWFGTATPKGIS